MKFARARRNIITSIDQGVVFNHDTEMMMMLIMTMMIDEAAKLLDACHLPSTTARLVDCFMLRLSRTLRDAASTVCC